MMLVDYIVRQQKFHAVFIFANKQEVEIKKTPRPPNAPRTHLVKTIPFLKIHHSSIHSFCLLKLGSISSAFCEFLTSSSSIIPNQ